MTDPNKLELVCVSSNPKRDERGHIVSIVFYARNYDGTPKAGDDAKKVDWYPLEKSKRPKMAFDHDELLDKFEIWRKND